MSRLMIYGELGYSGRLIAYEFEPMKAEPMRWRMERFLPEMFFKKLVDVVRKGGRA